MTDFETFKQQAKDAEPTFYDTTVGAVQLESANALRVEGNLLPMERSALSGMVELFGMNKTFADKFDQYVGEDTRLEFMDRFREALASNDDLGLTLAIDADEGKVTGINERAPRVGMEGFFQIVEDVLDRYGLEVGRYNFKPNGVSVATKNQNRRVDMPFDDEEYKTGLEFTSQMGQMDFRYMLERQICTNGMTAMVAADELRLASLKDRSVEKFFDSLHQLAERNFMPQEFADYLERSLETPASVAEVEDAFSVLKSASMENKNPGLLSRIPMHRIRAAYQDEGYPLDEMSRTEKHNALTDLSVHEVVNEITWVASHPDEAAEDGFEVTDSRAERMQSAAGDLFTKKNLDSENLVPSPFGRTTLN